MSNYYIPLIDRTSEDGEIPTNDEVQSATGQYSRYGHDAFQTKWMVHAALMIMFLCTVGNAWQLHWIATSLAPPNEAIPTRRPSMYIGLNRLSPSPQESFKLFPFLLTQVDRSSKLRVFQDDTEQVTNDFGTVWPDTRRFLIRDTISSVAQFRTIDYGYENCSITFSLEHGTSDGWTVNAFSSSSVLVDITLHLGFSQIPVGTLSYEALYHRPEDARQFQDTIPVIAGKETRGKSFPCPTDTFFTIEVSCHANTTSSCHMEFWNNPKYYPNLGFTMTQEKGFVSDM